MTVKDAAATSTGSDEAATAGPTFDRRGFMVLGAGGLLAAVLQSAHPAAAQSAARRGTLVIALDISDATGLDPVRVYQYSNPLPTHAAYDGMVTFDPGDSVNLKPALATEWAYQADGKTVRLKLRTDVKFASGKPMTAEDVRFSFTRQLNIKDQPWQYISHIEAVKVVDPHTVDIVLKDPSLPLMTIIATPAFGVLDSEALAMGRIRGANAAAATILRVSELPHAQVEDQPASAQSATAFNPIAPLTEHFYTALAELHAQVRDWEERAPEGERMTPETMATLWDRAMESCKKRGEDVTDAYGRPLRLSRLPKDLLELTDPRAVVLTGTRLSEDVENWNAWVAKEMP